MTPDRIATAVSPRSFDDAVRWIHDLLAARGIARPTFAARGGDREPGHDPRGGRERRRAGTAAAARRSAPRAVAAVAAVAVAGCSFAFTRPPPDPVPADGPVRCTDSVAAPTADTLLAAGAALAGVGALVANGPSFFLGTRVAVIDLGLFAALGASAIVGYRRTFACGDAKDRRRDAADPTVAAQTGH